MRVLALLLLAAPALLWAQPADKTPERRDAPRLEPYKIILVGDSTVAPNSGWGGGFCAHHVKWKIACINLARGARSTRSFRSEGGWDLALAEMQVPGYKKVYVLIQMGHNDQARHKPERWTEETTEYPDNLRRYVKEARAAGAVPVLVTPLTRREFRDGKIHNTLASWSKQVRKVARELEVPLIDLNARSAEAVQKMGAIESMKLAQVPPTMAETAAAATGTTLPPAPAPHAAAEDRGKHADKRGARGRTNPKFDYTHVGPEGADYFAGMVADDLADLAPELASALIP